MAQANIVIPQGSTFTTYLTLTDDDGVALDLTDYSAFGQIRKWYTSSSYVNFTVSIPAPATDGNIYIALTANATANMTPGRYVYDIETRDAGNNTTRVVEGIVTVTPEVTLAWV